MINFSAIYDTLKLATLLKVSCLNFNNFKLCLLSNGSKIDLAVTVKIEPVVSGDPIRST